MCPLASWEAKQAAPSDALVPGSWQCSTHDEAVAQPFGANPPKRRCLFAICAKQAMHLRVLSPTERVNRLHHATLCCLGAGSAIHTQLYVILSDSPSRAYCIHTAMPVCNLCYLDPASMCPLASREAEQAAPCDALVPGSWQFTTHAKAVAQAFGANATKRPCLCAICAKQAMHLRVLLPCRESEQTVPRDALVFGCWQCITDAAKCNICSLAPSASTQRCLCANCATEVMHLSVPLPLGRPNRLHHAMLWCLGAGNAPRTTKQ